jgi:Maltose operon periplasmic protein precursor (MalM)
MSRSTHRPSGALCRAALVGLVFLVARSGAATAGAPAAAGPYAGRSVCCTDPDQFEYTVLPDHGSLDVEIGRAAPLFEFQDGLSAFRAFRLPVMTAPYLIEVRSFLRGGPDPTRAKVFYPVAALLTGDHLVTRTVGIETLSPELPILERTTEPAYRMTIGIDPARGGERYLVLYTPYAALGDRSAALKVDSVEAAAEVARNAFLGASSEGRLRITVTSGNDDARAKAR